MRFHLSNLSLLTLLLLATFLQAQDQAAPSGPADQLPPVPGKVVTITPEAGYRNEPSIAVNAKDPSQLVAAYQTNASVAYSQDAGSSWKIATGTAPKDYRISGDVSVTYDKRGTAILCYIAFDKLGTINYWAHGATRNGIFVRRSPARCAYSSRASSSEPWSPVRQPAAPTITAATRAGGSLPAANPKRRPLWYSQTK